MTLTSRLHIPWHNTNFSAPSATPILPVSLGGPITTLTTTLILILLAAIVSASSKPPRANGKPIPLLNPKRWYELTTARARREYDADSWNMTLQGMEKYHGEPFRLLTGELDGSEAVLLPPRYAEELKNDERLSFTSLKKRGLHGELPGFETIGTLDQRNRIIQMVAQQDLTRALPRLTTALSAECAAALKDAVGEGKDWHDVVVRSGISLPLVARLSTLAFMGPEACYDQEWIDISISFTVNIMLATIALQAYPRWLRPMANYLVPECRLLRAQERRARDIIDEKLAARRRFREEEARQGRGSEVRPSDALDWFQSQHQRLGGEYNPALTQLMLSFAAIHTTADLLTQVMLDLAVHQNLIEPLRREIVEALDGGPIDKTATQKMTLLDSVMKETQRMKPMQIAFMEREVLQDVTLSNNVELKRGTATMIMPRLRDPTLYENPDEYDGYRFARLRQQAGKEKAGQLVTVTPDFIAFGFGTHACPGRFFAAHEAKLMMCHLLLKYDWKVAEGAEQPKWRARGNGLECDGLAKIAIRRRDAGEEVPL
ncbi:hypothetical protein J7T55_010900 [Diaporthe amygdali]|uniref:uncharacterized protein n=1 Tax=Phomopsis amygdali TaxID=1214568 RepID=UPI0022FDD481|nr:uncharacterized protein J7T55_010900 [Diaporthe amygdali]KAJ0104434.1 hypothetical protein J7T55_010900 [Diaporthe amygdali]